MTSFVHLDHPTQHAGISRVEAALDSARSLRQGFNGKGLAVMLLAAVGAALLVVADQVIDTWADGHLLAAWVALWAVAFAVLALFASSVRHLVGRTMRALDAWSQRVAQKRADQRLWSIAQTDPRIMSELQAAMSRHAADTSAVPAPARRAASFESDASARTSSLNASQGRARPSYYL